MTSVKTTKPVKATPESLKGCLVLVTLMLIVGYFINSIVCLNGSTSTSSDYDPDSSMAYVMGKEFVLKNLKAPATAEFPSGLMAHYEGDSIYSINSYVDSQNSFGALLRTEYYVRIKDNGGGQWKLLYIKLYE